MQEQAVSDTMRAALERDGNAPTMSNSPTSSRTLAGMSKSSSSSHSTTQEVLNENFQGINETTYAPPDPVIAVGPNYVVEAVNDVLAVFNKSGTELLEKSFSNLFGVTGKIADPKVIYDQYSQRYVIVALDFTSGNYEIAASASSDPTGTWYPYTSNAKYKGNTYTGYYPDYTGLGYDNTAIYITSDQYGESALIHFKYSKVRILDKSQLYNNQTLTYTDLAGMSDNYGPVLALKPAHHFGTTSSAYLINTEHNGGSSVTLWRIDNPISNPSIHQQAIINVASYSVPDSAIQEGSGFRLDAGDNRTQDCMWRDGYLYTAFTTKHNWGSGNVDAIQYLKINTSTNSAAIDAVYGSASSFYFYPNIYVDNYGNIALDFGRSSSNEYGSFRWAIRRPFDNAMESSQSLQEGSGIYIHYDQSNPRRNRWGDYSGIALDGGKNTKIWMCGEWATSLNAWSTQIGSFDFYPNTLSGPITSNLTLDGAYAVPSNVHISSNATLTIDAGTILGMGNGVEFIDDPGSKISANGTDINPVYMTDIGPNIVWNGVVLQGDGNTFVWTMFDHGHEDVDVESDNNTFESCTFQNGWRGISTYWNQSGDGLITDFTLIDCMVRDNSTVGVVVYNANASLNTATVTDNGSAGIWFYNSNPSNIYYNAFTSNDTDPYDYPNRSGLEVTGGSYVYLPDNARNLISENPTYQILNYSDGTLSMGTSGSPGSNSVSGGYGSIDNQSATTVNAYGNWWGTAYPTSNLFSGPVDYSGYLTSDPCLQGGPGCGAGAEYPGQMAPTSPEHMLVQQTANRLTMDTKKVASTTGVSGGALSNDLQKRRALMHTLWGEIYNAKDGQSLIKMMQQLYLLHMASWGDTSFTSERKQDRTLWGGMIQDYLNGTHVSDANNVILSASQVEQLMLMDEHEAELFGRYVEARSKVSKYTPYITSTRGKLALMTDRMNLLDQQGYHQKALAMLDKVEQTEVSLGVPQKQVQAEYAIAQQQMQGAIDGTVPMAPSSPNGVAGSQTDSVLSVKPTKMHLNANYPNPFNPTTIISYRLTQSVHVRLSVWNILGRRVATLVDANQQKGIHEVTFNASQLSSGVYFYRLQSGNKV
ncbi:MAG TPA: T9SS type A sorting domain-containing protein, partial [Balneolales bacterium]|nr:T9SS type A sorting domain-containing protein [Balneolales bacterium]